MIEGVPSGVDRVHSGDIPGIMPWRNRCHLCRNGSFYKLIGFLIFFIIIQLLFIRSYREDEYIYDIDLPEANKPPIGVYWRHPRCGCMRRVPKPAFPHQHWESSCNMFASLRGPHQKVISYSFYGSTKSGYFKSIATNVESVTKLYDGWLVRLYHNIPPDDVEGTLDLCNLVCKYSNLDDCYVVDLEEKQFGDLSSKFGMIWRFLALGDPTVDFFGSRDLDSPVYQREVDAVNDWISKNKTWHIMRDNAAHVTVILGGMWGARNDHNIQLMQELRQQIVEKGRSGFKSFDQLLLSQIVWPEAKKSMVSHDSYLCNYYQGAEPWPTQRVNLTFVGDMYGLQITKECPVECRPKDHKDWKYC